MQDFFYQQLRAAENNHQKLLAELRSGNHAAPPIWGVFAGLFGVAANELLVVSAPADAQALQSPLAVKAELWTPTARPQDASACDRAGLYVFRRFHVREADVDELVALSVQAWETFEVSDDYAAQPQGLFKPPADADGIVPMMLVTWYDGFASWQRSREPNPLAKENFARRHALTLTTYAVATRLLLPEA